MTIASLIPGADISVDRLDMTIDGWITPEFKLRSAIGEAQVEDGSKVVDHYTALPDHLKVTGIVDSVRSPGSKAVDAWAEVRRLHREGVFVKFVTEFGVWENCLIRSASTTIKTRGLEFMLELQQVRQISLGETTALSPAALDPGNPAANRQPIVEAGTKPPVTPTGGGSTPIPVTLRSDGSIGQTGSDPLVKIEGEDGSERVTLAKPTDGR